MKREGKNDENMTIPIRKRVKQQINDENHTEFEQLVNDQKATNVQEISKK